MRIGLGETLLNQHPARRFQVLAQVFDVGVRVVGEVCPEPRLVLWRYLGRASCSRGAFSSGQPYFAAVVVELFHSAGFFVGDGVCALDCFDVVARGEVGFDSRAGDGGEGAGHGCWLGGGVDEGFV